MRFHFKNVCLTTLFILLTICSFFLSYNSRSRLRYNDFCYNMYKAELRAIRTNTEVNDVVDSNVVREFRDAKVDHFIEILRNQYFFPDYFANASMLQLTRQLGQEALNSNRLVQYANLNRDKPLSTWLSMYANIRQHSIYDPDDPNLDKLMSNMATLPIKELDIVGGTQLNLRVVMDDGTIALMKPMRLPRDYEELVNTYYYDFKERHTAEIAAFQLDKILGFYKVPPTVGRKVNIVTEFMPVAPMKFNETVYTSEVNNTCFYGHCQRWCELRHSFCGQGDIIEVSVMMYMPIYLKHITLPWKRSWSHTRKADWETDDRYCDKVRTQKIFSNDVMLREAIDAYLFDFMTGNEDRHTFYYHQQFLNNTYSVMRDNGKGFGRYAIDAISNLKPLMQCCVIRKNTVLKFLKLYMGPEQLSTLMTKALSNDPVSPVLTAGHLTALDRRVTEVLKVIADCVSKHGVENVVINAQF